jgi:hypothetical protein
MPPNDKQSETPRVDAKVFLLRDGTNYNSGPNWGQPFMRSVVDANFARQLQRELDSAREALKQQAQEIVELRTLARSASAVHENVNICTVKGCGRPAIDQPKSVGRSVCGQHDFPRR